MVNEDYLSFEVAKLLKEKGFDEPCFMSYWLRTKDKPELAHLEQTSNNYSDCVSCPTLQMAMRWLREVYKIFIKINIVPYTTITMEQHYYFFTIYRERKPVYGHMIDYYYSTYEEAVEAALKYCLENLI